MTTLKRLSHRINSLLKTYVRRSMSLALKENLFKNFEVNRSEQRSA